MGLEVVHDVALRNERVLSDAAKYNKFECRFGAVRKAQIRRGEFEWLPFVDSNRDQSTT